MRITSHWLLFCFLWLSVLSVGYAADQKITFPSADGLLITADSYVTHTPDRTPLVLLFHQARWSRGEYQEIAPRLNALGFNCIAVDLRSGDYVKGKENETARRARNAGLSTSYVDAMPDMIAALRYVRKQHPDSKLIAWGSSYSASLVLKVAGDYPDLVDGVLAFSPGEYFSKLGKGRTWVKDSARNIRIPVFITSSSDEVSQWSSIYEVIDVEGKRSFVPPAGGKHGAKALWKKYADSERYWNAVADFLRSNFIDH